MTNQFYTFYTFQHRIVAESERLTKEPIVKKTEPSSWSFSSWDYFGGQINPLKRSGHGYVFAGSRETCDVWSKTNKNGFWTLKYAKQALARLRKADATGAFNVKESYGRDIKSVRREFRIVKVIYFPLVVEPVDE